MAGRLPAVELIGARGDDGKLRAAVDVMLRIASGAEDMAAELAKSQRARKSLEGRFAAAHEEGRLEAEALHKGRGLELDAWRQWARPHLAGASAIVNDGGLRIELSRLLEARVAVAKALRAPPSADLAGMVEAIRAAAGPSTLSGPGALAEQVARLREAADIARSTPEIGAEAIASLREIAALVRD